MAQSSNYKQYARTTRMLTEESGFAGGMLWTNNNIDATHLKAIVNFDYDETTGFLKSRDLFKSYDLSLKEWCEANADALDLTNKVLIGVYNICAYDLNTDSNTESGMLYIFAEPYKLENIWNVDDIASQKALVLYIDSNGIVHRCVTDYTEETLHTLCNGSLKQLLTLYDNMLYGFGPYAENSEAFLQVYRLEYDSAATDSDQYYFTLLDYDTYVQPRINSVTLLEAGVTGFNAARGEETFIYGSEAVDATETLNILGVYLTDENGDVIVSPRVGQRCTIYINTTYHTGKEHAVAIFQLKENGTTESTTAGDIWQFLKAQSKNDGTYSFEYVFQKRETTMAFVCYNDGAAKDTYEVYSADVASLLAPYVFTASNTMDNVKLKNYNLAIANNHCLWNGRMCVWGTSDTNNCLFLSEVENFYYYPVPHNIAVFDTNVISCIPYKDALLVFTADKIYRVVAEKDGTFTQAVVQNDMPMTKADASYLTSIKNMVLFKSGNYFYMVVPKSQSLTDELSIAPIYKNVAGFLNNLDKSTLEVLQLLYPERQFTDCIVMNNAPTDLYSEQDTIYILYDIQATASYKKEQIVQEGGKYVNKEILVTENNSFKLFLNYNTNLRAWSMYVEETTSASLEPATLTLARTMSFVRVNQQDGIIDVVTPQHAEDPTEGCRVLIDTGYRSLSNAVNKRFRELQIKLHSVSEKIVSFGTAFLVDGVWRRSYTKFEETLTAENTVTLLPAYDANTFIKELSMPVQEDGSIVSDGSKAIELSDWLLDFSHFKREAPTTVRIPVSGKGYNPRFIFMTPNATALTINAVNWVYRMMNGR